MNNSSLRKKVDEALRSCLYCALIKAFPQKYCGVRASVDLLNGKVIKSNWGDDLNEVLPAFLTSKKVLILPNNRMTDILKIPNYLVIGSIVTFFPLPNSVIWGSGIINNTQIGDIKGKPRKVCAVRGPRTRAELVKLGIDCPEVYGDPALLMPRFYKSKRTIKHKLGIIPHIKDISNSDFQRLQQDESVHFINVGEYRTWEEFIDEINSCEMVVSSSLHGIITAEAYGVPAKWISFGENEPGWNFKFWDFYESIKKNEEKPVIVTANTTLDELIYHCRMWKPGEIDCDELLKSCPF